MLPPSTTWILIPFLLFCCLFALSKNLRESLRDAVRCLRRYPHLWRIPTLFSLGNALSQMAAYAVIAERMGKHFDPWSPPGPLQDTLLRATENMAGVFNCIVVTFPLSALVAVFYLLNISGIRTELQIALKRHFPKSGGFLFAAIFLCALSALLKPFVYFGLIPLSQRFQNLDVVHLAQIPGFFSFLFEYLIAAFLQVYLLLMAFAWVRGLHFDRGKLLHFALRRLGYVMKWVGVVLTASWLLLLLPFLFIPNSSEEAEAVEFTLLVSRPLLALGMIGMASVQITLSLHNESLKAAIADHFRFLRVHGVEMAIFVLCGILLFFQAQNLLTLLREMSGTYTAWGILAQLLEPLSQGLLSGWLLAAWVCLYRRWSGGQAHVLF